MATFTDVFERKETKYRLDEAQYRAMLETLRGRMEPDAYGKTVITSVYYDTPERLLIQRSLDKPLYKEKLRMRMYGTTGVPDGTDRVFVEIKKKYDGIVYKRRVGMSYHAACAYLNGTPYEQACKRYPLPDSIQEGESTCARSLQIAHEIDSLFRRYQPLVASMSISCARTAYAPTIDKPRFALRPSVRPSRVDGRSAIRADAEMPDDLRITFDEDIRYCDLFAFNQESRYRPLLPQGDVIMEVKSSAPLPLWLVDALADCKAYPSSFSKYGEAYRSVVGSELLARQARTVVDATEQTSQQARRTPGKPAHAAADARQPTGRNRISAHAGSLFSSLVRKKIHA